MTPALRLTDLHSFYGKSHILQGVTLEVGPGEIVTLLGRNGAGKSTTLKSAVGLITPRQGRVELEGRDVTGQSAYKIAAAGLSLVPEDRGIFQLLTVEEICASPRGAARPGRCATSTGSFHGWRSAAGTAAASFRAANSRCCRLPVRC